MPRIYINEWPYYAPPDQAKKDDILIAAKLMMNAIFTAPNHGGVPQIEGCIAYGYDEIDKIAKKMEELASQQGDQPWERIFKYEATMVRESDVVLFVGSYRAAAFPFDAGCGLCGGRPDCSYVYERRESRYGLVDIAGKKSNKLVDGPLCSLHMVDLGLAVGSAMSISTRLLVDAMPLVGLGMAGQRLDYCPKSKAVMGIGVSALFKNPYVDINPDYNLVNVQTVVEQARRAYSIFPRQTAVAYKKWDPSREFIYAPCEHACPIHMDSVGYIAFIAQGKFDEALALIRRRTPLAGVLGRTCHHPCEAQCRRAQLDYPVSILALKRFVADYEMKAGKVPPVPAIGELRKEKIAIVGSGPAGLNAAFHLAKFGYKVTIFESLPIAGGLLAVGIPEYRLPKEVLRREIKLITDMGVEIKTNTPIGRQLSLDNLLKQGYNAVFIAIGAHQGQKLGVPGEELKGVFDGISFLRETNLGKKVQIGKRIIIIGGGNVAIDAARSAIRLGAEGVTVVYRRTRDEMPCIPEELLAAEHEGVKFVYLASPVKISGDDGRVARVEFMPMELAAPGADGRRTAVPGKAPTICIDADTVISAIGQVPDLSLFSTDLGLSLNDNLTFKVDPGTLATNRLGVFAGGDAIGGAGTVVDALASGEAAAIAIDCYIQGKAPVVGSVRYPEKRVPIPRAEDIPTGTKRPDMSQISLSELLSGFKEVNQGLTEEQAVKEAKRCVRCDIEMGASSLLFGKLDT